MIFEPGTSTADQVTDVSGRGVGMDVVKKIIDRLRGNVETHSAKGKGCRFVPLTRTHYRIAEERYIIPLVFIKETLRPSGKDLTLVQNHGEVVRVRENLLPLVRLHRLLGVNPRKANPWEALVVVVETEGHSKGVMVDDLIGKQEVVIKNLSESLRRTKSVAGATIMGDGRMGLILDIQGLLETEWKPGGKGSKRDRIQQVRNLGGGKSGHEHQSGIYQSFP